MRTAVVLFNLGGPDTPAAVQPFLFNLFNDPSIIGAPGPIRYMLARLIAARRAPVAREIYARIGGGSPLLANTEAQAQALRERLAAAGDVRVFIAMRYWHPMSDAAAAAVKAWSPDRVVLLPLYPQYSTTTTASSVRAWHQAARKVGLTAPTTAICCYAVESGFVDAMIDLLQPAYASAQAAGRPRVLFSAHGLPKRVVARGDPYQWQVEQTAAAIVRGLGIADLDWSVCYQSRVGPLAWIEPHTDAEVERAGRDRVPLVVVPIAFVSEHSETLVELDLEYRARATACGVPLYVRVPTVSTHPAFVAGLARLVTQAMEKDAGGCMSQCGGRICPADRRGCPQS
ncbi:MAG TPA: ferrochelatase [Alphaproteobacteria bacterium]